MRVNNKNIDGMAELLGALVINGYKVKKDVDITGDIYVNGVLIERLADIEPTNFTVSGLIEFIENSLNEHKMYLKEQEKAVKKLKESGADFSNLTSKQVMSIF